MTQETQREKEIRELGEAMEQLKKDLLEALGGPLYKLLDWLASLLKWSGVQMTDFLYRFVRIWNKFKILIGHPKDPKWITKIMNKIR